MFKFSFFSKQNNLAKSNVFKILDSRKEYTCSTTVNWGIHQVSHINPDNQNTNLPS